MKVFCSKYSPLSQPSLTQRGSSRPLVLAVVCFVLGAALAGFWFYHQNSTANGQYLSEQTKHSLAGLSTPVSIKFYSFLPANSADEALTAFSSRVAQLLAAMQEAGNGNIQISTIEGTADTNASAAAIDGIQAFNMDKGDACFLGLSVNSGSKKQSMARLQPEWESALQYDLARTILEVAKISAPPVRPEVAKPSVAIVDSIHRLIPDVSAVTQEKASQIFHAEFMKECATAGAEMEAQIQAAQQKVVQAQAGGLADEIAAAHKNLMQVQLEQGEKMKQVAADLQTRLAVFQQMKTASPTK